MPPGLEGRVELAREAAQEAAALLLEGLGVLHRVEVKSSPADLVSEVDRRSEEAIRSRVRARFPGDAFLGEEGGTGSGPGAAPQRAGALPWARGWCWVVDPLDGTNNYLHGIPFFAVSMALLEDGRLRYGLTLDPVRGERFEAWPGGGAWLGERPLHVSREERIPFSLVATGFPFDRRGHRRNLDRLAAVADRVQNVRTLGSAALALAYVAAGRLEAFWELHLAPWDMAAGALLVREAGGSVSDADGRPFRLEGGTVLAGAPAVHDWLKGVFGGAGLSSSRES
ncbi:MAG: inositol monophosphatase family protein [Bacillota bacterium]|nr:inositol monophosphatase family protein [Bacillota bacterium]